MRLATNCDGFGQIVGREGRQCIEQPLPTELSIGDQFVSCTKRIHKFIVPVSPRFLSIRREKVCPTGKQVARHMLHDDGAALHRTPSRPNPLSAQPPFSKMYCSRLFVRRVISIKPANRNDW